MTSCLTTTIEIDRYREIDVQELRGKTDLEIQKALAGQINEMSAYIDYLVKQIIEADRKRIIVIDLRKE